MINTNFVHPDLANAVDDVWGWPVDNALDALCAVSHYNQSGMAEADLLMDEIQTGKRPTKDAIKIQNKVLLSRLI